MANADMGLIGLAVMGENLVLNMESKGFTVAVYQKIEDWRGGRSKVGKHHQAVATGGEGFHHGRFNFSRLGELHQDSIARGVKKFRNHLDPL